MTLKPMKAIEPAALLTQKAQGSLLTQQSDQIDHWGVGGAIGGGFLR